MFTFFMEFCIPMKVVRLITMLDAGIPQHVVIKTFGTIWYSKIVIFFLGRYVSVQLHHPQTNFCFLYDNYGSKENCNLIKVKTEVDVAKFV